MVPDGCVIDDADTRHFRLLRVRREQPRRRRTAAKRLRSM